MGGIALIASAVAEPGVSVTAVARPGWCSAIAGVLHGAGDAVGIDLEDAQDVDDQGRNPVLLHPIGPARGAEAAPVWRDHFVTSPDELGDLVPPQSCGIREAVQQQDGRLVPPRRGREGKPR